MCRENNVKTQWKTVTCFCNFSGLLSIKSTISLLTTKKKNSVSLITESKKHQNETSDKAHAGISVQRK